MLNCLNQLTYTLLNTFGTRLLGVHINFSKVIVDELFSFSDVVFGEEFTSLSCQEVTSLISQDKLNVAAEEKVF